MRSPASPGSSDRSAALSAGEAWYALVVMTACYSLAFVDRQIINLLVEPLKAQFGATDVQVGYLLGPAFTFSYVGLGLPAGWCADRFNRRTLVLVAGLLWSLGAVAAAFVHTYGGMVLSRIVVGGAEAFLFPAGMSLIAELFDRKRLPMATSIFLLSPYIGGGLALIFGGLVLGYTMHMPPIALPYLGLMQGWRLTFLAAGFLGLVPILLLIPVREPSRLSALAGGEADRRFGLLDGAAYMLRRWRFYALFFFGMAFSSLVLATVPAWAPSFLVRQFGMSQDRIGVEYGALVLIFGVAGGVASPLVNQALARRHADAPMRTVLLGPVMLMVFAALLSLVANRTLALGCLALVTFAYTFPLCMAGVSLQLATPPRLRGLASAFYFVIGNLVAWGLGPMLVPMFTGRLFHDATRIGPALSLICVTSAMLALVLLSCAIGGFRQERGLNRRGQAILQEA